LNERGLFKVSAEEARLVHAGRREHEHSTDSPEASVNLGMKLVKYYERRAEQLRFAGELKWQMARMMHAAGVGTVNHLAAAMAKSGVMPTSLADVEQFVKAKRKDLGDSDRWRIQHYLEAVGDLQRLGTAVELAATGE
jgi:hypothetical protein